MQLVSLPVSPFAARVRIALYAKGLDAEIVPPPQDWQRSASFLRLNPLGRVPVLITDDGEIVQESSIILEYLEERFPDTRSLMPQMPEERAAMRLLMRLCDLYLMPPMVALARPATPDSARAQASELISALDILEQMLPQECAYAVAGKLTLADCALAPVLFAARVTGERLQIDLLEGRSATQQYQAQVKHEAAVAIVLDEMETGLRALSR